jgi:ubiquinone biosynthesis protein COQ9
MEDQNYQKLYNKTLEMLAFDGCTDAAITNALKALELPEAMATIYFPEGISHIVKEELSHHLEETKQNCTASKSITATTSSFLESYIDSLENNKKLSRHFIKFLLNPKNYSLSSNYLWEIANTSWRLTIDNAVDFSYYTKRATLIAVLSATLLYWLKDGSDGASDTKLFIKRRLDNVTDFHVIKSKYKNYVSKLFPSFS